MTVNNTNVTAGPYIGNNTSSVFSYEFKILDSDELNVYETDDNGVETLLTLDTNYTVQDVGEAVGTVTRSAGNLPTGYTWFIVSNYDELQETSFSSQGAFFPKIHERAFDKLTKLVQQTAYNVSNAFKNLDMRGFKIINLKDAVDPQDAATFGQVTILNDETAASATASANSATASANSATASANSATASANSATASANSATASANSATASANSATASETALSTFVDTQWGAYATEPALSPIGNPATSGNQYFNTTSNTMRVYNGSAWQATTPIDFGTMAEVDKQTSPTDATAGRGMINGAFGRGVPDGEGILETGNDLDTLLNEGKTYQAGFTNGPAGVSGGFFTVTPSHALGFTKQEITDGDTGILYARSLISSVWSAWQPVYTGANYQPDDVNGLNVVRLMKNVRAYPIAIGAAESASGLQFTYVTAAGAVIAHTSTAPAGTWFNVAGVAIPSGQFGYFVRAV